VVLLGAAVSGIAFNPTHKPSHAEQKANEIFTKSTAFFSSKRD
jgi:hypothetical protein